jgi:hypothetical protein
MIPAPGGPKALRLNAMAGASLSPWPPPVMGALPLALVRFALALLPGQCAKNTGNSAADRMWLVAPPKIICLNRLCVYAPLISKSAA